MSVQKLRPTDEQEAAIELFGTGDNLAIEAGAGTGKTSTLRMLAAATKRKGRYIAFNRGIVEEAKRTMPKHVVARTAHSMAYAAVGWKYQDRLKSGTRQQSAAIARVLGMTPLRLEDSPGRELLSKEYLAGLVMRSINNFCQSADPEPVARHVPYVEGIDYPYPDGSRGWSNNTRVRQHVLPALAVAWADLVQTKGSLRYTHAHYLKLWQLQGPRIAADFILFDEAQDASPVMVDIVASQRDAQLVWVGDSQQQIYGFTGAINALATVPTDHRTFLTQSFRFGQPIADQANVVLGWLGSPLMLRGNGTNSVVGPVDQADIILSRTNATAVATYLQLQDEGRRPYIVGGAVEVIAFAKAADALKAGRVAEHPELACFKTWGEVQDYCLAPGTRVLTADMTWQPVELLAVGDDLVGFDEEAGLGTAGRRYRKSTVEKVNFLYRPTWKITFEDGSSVVASIEHRWLTRTGGNNLRWQRTDGLRPGSEVASIGPTWQAEETRDAGWLAGIYDGEGWCVRPAKGTAVLGVSQNEGPILERIRSLLKERGFDFTDRAYSRCRRLVLTGGFAEKLRFLGTIRPERLLRTFQETGWEGGRVEARVRRRVRSVEAYSDSSAVVAVQTSTRTFIAEGLLSHNCRHDQQGEELRLLVGLVEKFGADAIIAGLNSMTAEARADVRLSTAHKAKGLEWSTVKLADDFAGRTPEGEMPYDEELRLIYVAVTRAQESLDVGDVKLLAGEDEDEGLFAPVHS